ncbi:Nuclear intron maturase 3, mitochondrial isoform B [Glycine soja]|uniref:Nuclear intron maturase 3, mitochondrial isoform B n=1 Tax=Glycine soja TaxID=3848 RepID=A0A445GHC9_GLYSO|nr:Nuclear intron maturase 3, mitochondrial isoform B [Glycine soja]
MASSTIGGVAMVFMKAKTAFLQSSIQLLDILDVSRTVYLQNSSAFVGVGFYSSVRDLKAQELASVDPESTFFCVEAHVVFMELSEYLFQVYHVLGYSLRLDDHVVDIDLDVSSDPLLENMVHQSLDVSDASVLMASEVPAELHALLEFGFELQLDELFNRLWASIREEHEHLVDSQGSDWRPLIHTHDLGAFKLGRLPSGRIRCHLQDFCIALSFLLLISLDNHDLSRQDWKFHLQMWHGDNGSELIECFYANQSKVDVASGLYSFPCKAEEWTDMSETGLVDEDHGHHEVGDYDGDNHGVILVDGVDTHEVFITESDRRETLWRWCIDIVDINVPNGMEVVLARLARLSFVGESAPNGVDQPSYFLGPWLGNSKKIGPGMQEKALRLSRALRLHSVGSVPHKFKITDLDDDASKPFYDFLEDSSFACCRGGPLLYRGRVVVARSLSQTLAQASLVLVLVLALVDPRSFSLSSSRASSLGLIQSVGVFEFVGSCAAPAPNSCSILVCLVGWGKGRMASYVSMVASLHLHIRRIVFRNAHPRLHSTLTKPQFKALVLDHYSHGKFSNLIQNIVASPPVLHTACQNLSPSFPPPDRFSIPATCRELLENRFDVASCCLTLTPSFVLPNLKLKVVIEAIRMVLEIVYDDRFVTFCYGGRVGMGRHTAIRYLKNSLENPTWWFTVRFKPHRFQHFHVEKLCSVIESKVKDSIFIDLIKRLFQCKALVIELGADWLGRGLPQECGLCSILINVYFDAFDKEIQEMRLRENRENRELDPKIIASGLYSDVFYKPVKVYAVRYLDEILLATSGSKMLALELRMGVVKTLELGLGLRVDKVNTAIHSAVSEKIEFLGMELQAVPPSILRPPMSEKAIRARKKYLRQKEVRALELRNARARNRRKLGLKIFSHVYKKFKQSDGFKFDFSIENQVREIFRSWADEVVQEFLGNIDECQEWHRSLSAGDFLQLRHIRNQLPPELVDAYDKFQEQVDKHLNPIEARKAIEEEERRVKEEEEQNYSKGTVEDLTKLCMKVEAPEILIRKAVKLVGFTNHMGRPRPIEFLVALEDADIIKWYAGIARRWLDYFCCCHNFKTVKTIVTYHLRFSCILTLAEKHESTKREVIKHFSKDLRVYDMNGNHEVYFPTEREVKMMGDRNLSDPKPVDGALSLAVVRLASDEPPCHCIAHFCDKTTTVFYRVHLLQNRLNVSPLDKEKWVQGMGVIHESLNRSVIGVAAGLARNIVTGMVEGTVMMVGACEGAMSGVGFVGKIEVGELFVYCRIIRVRHFTAQVI